MAIDLGKKISLVKEVLKEKKIDYVKANISVVLDISFSMNSFFNYGVVQELVERLLAVGLNMDVENKINVYLFGENAHRATPATINNIEDYVQKHILKKFRLEGSTYYAPVMQMISDDLGYITAHSITSPKALFKGLMKKSKDLVTGNKQPADKTPNIVFFITDGDNFDKDRTTYLVKELATKPVFWQFIGIGGAHLRYLEELDEMPGRYVDNANFFKANDIANISDEELYERILSELPDWLKEAKKKGLID